MLVKQLSAAPIALLFGACAHTPQLGTTPTAAEVYSTLPRHDKFVAASFYRDGHADVMHAWELAARHGQGRMPDTGTNGYGAAPDPREPKVQRSIINLPVPAYQDVDGTYRSPHLEPVEVYH